MAGRNPRKGVIVSMPPASTRVFSHVVLMVCLIVFGLSAFYSALFWLSDARRDKIPGFDVFFITGSLVVYGGALLYFAGSIFDHHVAGSPKSGRRPGPRPPES